MIQALGSLENVRNESLILREEELTLAQIYLDLDVAEGQGLGLRKTFGSCRVILLSAE